MTQEDRPGRADGLSSSTSTASTSSLRVTRYGTSSAPYRSSSSSAGAGRLGQHEEGGPCRRRTPRRARGRSCGRGSRVGEGRDEDELGRRWRRRRARRGRRRPSAAATSCGLRPARRARGCRAARTGRRPEPPGRPTTTPCVRARGPSRRRPRCPGPRGADHAGEPAAVDGDDEALLMSSCDGAPCCGAGLAATRGGPGRRPRRGRGGARSRDRAP